MIRGNPRMKKTTGYCAGWIILCVIGLAGCAAVAAGGVGAGGTYAYLRGELKRTVEADYDRVWEATNKAVQDMELYVEEMKKDSLSAKFKGYLASGDQFVIKLKSEDPEFVSIRIRIGHIGDQNKSERIMQEIQNNL